jgi:L-serine dehydratase
MAVSIFDLFTLGIGPSSSHTVGPMRAARRFAERLEQEGLLAGTERVRAELFGSLAHTGRGHGTDRAVLMGLEGETPEEIDPDCVEPRVAAIRESGRIALLGRREIPFREGDDLVFNRRDLLPLHSNGMRFTAWDGSGTALDERVYYSVGGGFVVNEGAHGEDQLVEDHTPQPYPFWSGEELLETGGRTGLAIWELMLENEKAWRSEGEVRSGLLRIWEAMQRCVERGCRQTGVLPGGLKVPRRAPALYQELISQPEEAIKDPLTVLDWVNLFALAVNEENAAGGRVVTAPTNGAAGIVPAVLHYYRKFTGGATEEGDPIPPHGRGDRHPL